MSLSAVCLRLHDFIGVCHQSEVSKDFKTHKSQSSIYTAGRMEYPTQVSRPSDMFLWKRILEKDKEWSKEMLLQKYEGGEY